MCVESASRAVKTVFLRIVPHAEQLHLFTPHQLSIHDFISCGRYLSHGEKSDFHIRMFTHPTNWLPSKNFFSKYISRINKL